MSAPAVQTITRGLAKIEVGAVAGDGGPGTTLAQLGYSDRASGVTLIEDDPTEDELLSHEVDDALDVELTAGRKTLTYTLVDMDLATLATVFGGTVTGEGNAATYSLPSNKATKDQTVKITPKKGWTVTIPRGSFYGKINADYSKQGKFAIDIVVRVLQPTKAGVGPIIWGAKV